ncbi:MAG TPA: hypothetical protein VKU87_08465 [Thermomicrobiaceae bacterium]|nr:hypothetical protein [Thermomicrobiaceae bacterium]
MAMIGIILFWGVAANADENSDLNLIPQGVTQPQSPTPEPPTASAGNQRIYLENAAVASSLRSNLLVPFPPPSPPDWQERLFLDARKQWQVNDQLSFTLSDRFNLRAESDIAVPSHENVINEFREGYVSWQLLERTYLDAGRINLKSGAAIGFNPTDFFKTRAVVEPLSVDPTVLREDRLGTLMVEGQHIWEGAAVLVAFAPKLYNPTAVYNNSNLRSLDPSFDRTNANDRLLIKGNVTLYDDLAPEFLVYRQGNQTSFGANVTESIGQKTVAYAEWAGGERSSLIDAALRYGHETGTLPPNASGALPEDPRRHFQNQLSVGASYTTESKITFNLEYHFDQAAFSRRDWDNWFRIGAANVGSPSIPRELWFIRSYALDQQEPISEHSLFLRADWVDAFVPNLELVGFINTDLYDGSSLVQLEADYYLSNAWTVGGLVIADLGRKHSDFGSLPQAGSALLKLARYF